jgi:fimbrial chaperone protein
MMKVSFHQAACGLVLFAATASSALAGSFQVSPVSATLTGRQPVSALTVRNTGSVPAVIQLEAMAWSQPGGKDQYVPATDILATPPIFSIPAGGSQVIRVGSRQPPGSGERAYRLFLREVPPAPKPGFNGLQMTLQISLPLFIQPDAAMAPRLEWQATRMADGQVRIHVTNLGQVHARLSRIKLSAGPDANPLPISDKTIYVLSGTSHDWMVKAPIAAGTRLHFIGEADGGPVQADLVVVGR